MKMPADVYAWSSRVDRGLEDLTYRFTIRAPTPLMTASTAASSRHANRRRETRLPRRTTTDQFVAVKSRV
jgi:hypothetical protein